MSKRGIPFIALGTAFLGIGIANPRTRTFLYVGIVFLIIGIVFLRRTRR